MNKLLARELRERRRGEGERQERGTEGGREREKEGGRRQKDGQREGKREREGEGGRERDVFEHDARAVDAGVRPGEGLEQAAGHEGR